MASKKQNQLSEPKELAQSVYAKARGRFKTRRSIVLLVIFLLIAFFVYRRATSAKFEVDVAVVKREKFVERISASGEVTADEAIDLNFETGGTVAQVAVKLGQKVKKGDLIAKLDTTNLYSAYLQAEADLRAKQSSLDVVYDNLKGIGDAETFEEKETRTLAETNKDKSYRAFVITSRNLAGATLRAPFDGIIANMPEGLAIGTNISLAASYQFSVVNPKTIYFITEVSELDIPRLTSNQKVKIRLDAYPGEIYEGVIEGMAFESVTTSTGGSAFLVRVTLPGQNALKFKVGMNGDADFIVSERDAQLLVPITAVVEANGDTHVWVLDGRRAKRVQIEPGDSSIDDLEVLSGIKEGDTVIIRPPSDLEDGDRVAISSQ
ncbi:efflux RND transporter periplasmic adaptor subunit [Patescibacteria group bacterium]|nr:efflux RND transporter periplasmic adaptor subunit [Patescibacteria group bacterium]